MDLVFSSMASLYEVAKVRCSNMFHPSTEWFMARREHWPMGFMLGLSGAASIMIGDPTIPKVLSYGAVLGFTIAAVKYIQQNLDAIIVMGLPTAFTLLATTLVLFPIRVSNIMMWWPVFTCGALLTAVNIAPNVIRALQTLSTGFSVMIIRPSPTARRALEGDLEEGQGLLLDMVDQNIADPASEDMHFVVGHMDLLDRVEHPESREDSDESISLQSNSVTTWPSIRFLLNIINGAPNPRHQGMAFDFQAEAGTRPRRSEPFPRIPQDRLQQELLQVQSAPALSSPNVELLPG